MRFNRIFDFLDLLSLVAIGLFGLLLFTIGRSFMNPAPVNYTPGTLLCVSDNTPTVQLSSSDVKYEGGGVWRLKHDVSGQYTEYVKAINEGCLIVPGKGPMSLIPPPQAPSIPPTTAQTPEKFYGET